MNLDDGQLETIKTAWTVDGDSASQIARRLACGISRNAVIGICHRRGWVQAGGGGRRSRTPSTARAPRPAKPLPAPAAEKKTELVLDPKNFVAFDQLGPHHCRYPVDAGGKDGLYCGLMPNGTPYCDGHAEKVYSPQQPRKIKRPR